MMRPSFSVGLFNSVGTSNCCQLHAPTGGTSIIILLVSGPFDFSELVSLDSGHWPGLGPRRMGASAKTKLAQPGQAPQASSINAPQELHLLWNLKYAISIPRLEAIYPHPLPVPLSLPFLPI